MTHSRSGNALAMASWMRARFMRRTDHSRAGPATTILRVDTAERGGISAAAMRAVWIPRPGPPEVLEVREGADPVAKPDQVLVRVHGSGVNFADVSARLGFYPDAPPPPCVVGYEVSGVVEQAGPNATGIKVGDRVFALTRFGGYADLIAIPAP